jgi:hypothetical protein
MKTKFLNAAESLAYLELGDALFIRHHPFLNQHHPTRSLHEFSHLPTFLNHYGAMKAMEHYMTVRQMS